MTEKKKDDLFKTKVNIEELVASIILHEDAKKSAEKKLKGLYDELLDLIREMPEEILNTQVSGHQCSIFIDTQAKAKIKRTKINKD